MSSLFIAGMSGGLPTDFYDEVLYESHESSPDKLPVGSRIIDVAWQSAYVLCQATDAKINDKTIVQQVVTVIDDTTDLALVDGVRPAKGAGGLRSVILTAPSVTKDQFMNGTLKTLGVPVAELD